MTLSRVNCPLPAVKSYTSPMVITIRNMKLFRVRKCALYFD